MLSATDISPCSLAALAAAHRIVHDQLIVLHSSEAESNVERRRQLERLRFLAPMNESHTVCVEQEGGEVGVFSDEPDGKIHRFCTVTTKVNSLAPCGSTSRKCLVSPGLIRI